MSKRKSAFFYFMLDWKKRAEREGYAFPNGLKDVKENPDCQMEWESLNKSQRAPFQLQASIKTKIEAPKTGQGKKTTYGEFIKNLEAEGKREEEYTKTMHNYIETTLSQAAKRKMPKLKFCVMHANYFFEKRGGPKIEYFPAEYAIGVFSLETGLEKFYHEIVSAPIPVGYKLEARETSKAVHNIPMEYSRGESNFAKMYEKLLEFLESVKVQDAYPPIFTTNRSRRIISSVLTKLSNTERHNKPEFLVYDLEILFSYYANLAYKNRKDSLVNNIAVVSEYIFQRMRFPYRKGIECFFHKPMYDGGYEQCSLAILKQWVFSMCYELCVPFGVRMVKNVHYPADLSPLPLSNIYGTSDEETADTQDEIKESEKILKEESCQAESMVKDLKLLTLQDDEKPGSSHEKPMQASDITPCTSAEHSKHENYDFPPAGGRGIICKPEKKKEKVPMGRGKGGI